MTEHQFRPWARLLLGYGLAIAALAFTARSLNTGMAQLETLPRHTSMMAIAACALLMAAHTALNREGFVLLCNALDSGLPPVAIRRMWGRSLLAKYVPGGVWQLVGRGLQMRQLGSRNNSAISSGILEQALSLALCSVIAAFAYLLVSSHTMLATMLGILSIIALWFSPCLMPWVKKRTTMRQAMLLYAVAMPFYLAAYACISPQLPLPDLCAYLFTGTLAGMVAFFVPGGIGVRESVISLLATDGNAVLLAGMVLVRLITLGVEIMMTLASFASRPR